MDLVYYSEIIPSAMPCGYFVLVKILLCRHYPMLKDLSLVGVSQDLAISQTGYITRQQSDKCQTNVLRIMDLVHYSEGIPSAMHCGYFVLVKMLLCRHYPMLKGLFFSGISQDLAISQTGYLTRKCSEKDFTAYNKSV